MSFLEINKKETFVMNYTTVGNVGECPLLTIDITLGDHEQHRLFNDIFFLLSNSNFELEILSTCQIHINIYMRGVKN